MRNSLRSLSAAAAGLMIVGAAIYAAGPVEFVDATAAAGITFVHSPVSAEATVSG